MPLLPGLIEHLKMAASRGALLFLALLVACAGSTRRAVPPAGGGNGTQPFVDRPAPDYEAPVLQPSPYPATQPPCRASQLRATPDPNVGAAAGNVLYVVRFTNASRSPCLLGGKPVVEGLDASGGFVPLPTQEGGTYFNDPAPADIAPGETGYLNIGTANAGNCPEIPEVTFRQLRFGFPEGWLDTNLTITVGCGNLAISGIGKEPGPAPEPTSAPGEPGSLQVSIDQPASVRTGETMRYTVTLSNPTDIAVSLTPCPSYTQG